MKMGQCNRVPLGSLPVKFGGNRRKKLERVRRVLQSKLNEGNTIGAINTWAVSLVRYTAGIINWRKDELEAMDRKTRKMMTIYNSLHPRADVDRLYIPRKHSGPQSNSVSQIKESK